MVTTSAQRGADDLCLEALGHWVLLGCCCCETVRCLVEAKWAQGDFWTVLVELLVRLLVAFPTAA